MSFLERIRNIRQSRSDVEMKREAEFAEDYIRMASESLAADAQTMNLSIEGLMDKVDELGLDWNVVANRVFDRVISSHFEKVKTMEAQ